MRLIIPKISNFHHVSLYVCDEFISTIDALQVGEICSTHRVLDKLLLKYLQYGSMPSWNKNGSACFSIAMGIDSIPGVNTLLQSNLRILYLFDAWPDKHTRIEKIVKHLKIDLLLVSSSQSASMLQVRLPRTKVLFCPEACKVEEYKCKPLIDRKIDLLQLGRRYEPVHKALIADSGLNYLYQKESGSLTFASQDLLKQGFADSKLSLCFPKTMTHPVESGGVETVTNRYFQSMASKCLVIGKAPQELIQIFGYNPVVELDLKDPLGHVKKILDNITDYESFIEHNYTILKRDHTWLNRWLFIRNEINKLS